MDPSAQKVHLADRKKAIKIPDLVLGAYDFFGEEKGMYDFREGGDLPAGLGLATKDWKLLTRKPFVDPIPGKVRVMQGVKSPEEAGKLLVRAEHLMPLPESREVIYRTAAKTALRRTSDQEHSSYPWLMNPDPATQPAADLLLRNTLVTISNDAGESQFSFFSEPAITEELTKHPYIWQVRPGNALSLPRCQY